MDAADPSSMLNESGPMPLQEAQPIDPYGDVALGVECAWPEVLPVLQAHERGEA